MTSRKADRLSEHEIVSCVDWPERTAERRRSTADNRFAHLRLQFVSVYRGVVLVFDQLARFMAIAHFPEKFPPTRRD
jgi:hypothetical protein